MPRSWSPYAGLDGEAGSQRSRHDFRHSGDEAPPDLWDFDSTNSEELFDINTDLLAVEVEADPNLRAQLSQNGELDNSPSISPGVSASKPLAQNLTRGKVSNIETLRGEGKYTDSQSHAVPPAIYIRQNETQGHHLGGSSVAATLAICLADGLKSQHLPLEPYKLRFLIEAGPQIEEIGLSSLQNLSSQSLPPRDTAFCSLQAYFRNINATLPILDEDLFMARVEMFYTQERIQLDIFDYCKFYLAISIGALSDRGATSKPCSDADELYSTCYRQAWSIMLDSLAAPCEASVQILLLHVVYQLHFGRCGIAWVFCGLAVRIAQSLGLHQRSPPDIGFSERRRAIRTRLWFLIFGLDANLSLSQGRSPGTSSEVFEKCMVIDHQPFTELEASPGFLDIRFEQPVFVVLRNYFYNKYFHFQHIHFRYRGIFDNFKRRINQFEYFILHAINR
ncbi:fungal specific transcription factor domain-containing protein [Colletotrichum gloeosporioides Cg-14]|uniref:Fungal specific transcription factor domain-containing protein n=1 Tax=Colletotrichum gloeosporioides (strain Cg-14) TaxID=1237896 RepID=T0LPK9_COLGC|nr:fungal specific transcription factor domain-containing protein [Colletotrichum gloeosporioides Cg-14]